MDQDLDRFWDACRSRPPLRLVIRDRDRPDSGGVRFFARPFVLIGRDPRNDLVLDHPEISRRHAYIQVLEGRAFCFDLDSRTAISWSGSPRRSGWFEAHRPIQLGQFRLELPSSEEGLTRAGVPSPGLEGRRAADPLWAHVPPGSDGFQPVLERADSPGGPVRWTIDHPLTLVGRSPECGLKLSDLSVSRFHAALVRVVNELWIVDLLGREGLQVNDEPVRWARLDRGDRLKIGRFHLVVRAVPSDAPMRRVATSYEAGPSRPLTSRPGLRLVSDVEAAEPTSSLPAVRGGPGVVSQGGEIATPVLSTSPAPIVPSVSSVPGDRLATEILPESIRYAEAMLAPILNQLSMMQQQMFEQYHQSMMAMVQMFGKLQQDQQELMDRELEEIRRLTREVREVQMTLAATPPAGPGMGPAGVSFGAPAPPIAPVVPGARSAEPPTGGPLASPATQAAGHAQNAPPLGTTGNRVSEAPEADYRQVQAALIQRMAELQQERQSRWQSLLGRLTGNKGDL